MKRETSTDNCRTRRGEDGLGIVFAIRDPDLLLPSCRGGTERICPLFFRSIRGDDSRRLKYNIDALNGDSRSFELVSAARVENLPDVKNQLRAIFENCRVGRKHCYDVSPEAYIAAVKPYSVGQVRLDFNTQSVGDDSCGVVANAGKPTTRRKLPKGKGVNWAVSGVPSDGAFVTVTINPAVGMLTRPDGMALYEGKVVNPRHIVRRLRKAATGEDTSFKVEAYLEYDGAPLHKRYLCLRSKSPFPVSKRDRDTIEVVNRSKSLRHLARVAYRASKAIEALLEEAKQHVHDGKNGDATRFAVRAKEKLDIANAAAERANTLAADKSLPGYKADWDGLAHMAKKHARCAAAKYAECDVGGVVSTQPRVRLQPRPTRENARVVKTATTAKVANKDVDAILGLLRESESKVAEANKALHAAQEVAARSGIVFSDARAK